MQADILYSGWRPEGRAIRAHLAVSLAWALLLTAGLSLGLAAADPGVAGLDMAQPAAAEPSERLVNLLAGQGLDLAYEIYQIRAGDTVENIAARFGVPAERIRQFNNLPKSAWLQPGQSLAIPLPARPVRTDGERGPMPAALTRAPCYAVVITASPITRQPTTSTAAQVLYEAEPGSQLVVNAEQGDHWGLIMIDGSTGWIAKSAVEMTGRTISPEVIEVMLKGGRPDIVQEAFRYLHTPYRYGGRLPYDLDCSLLVQSAFAARGIRLPRTAAEQFEVGRRVNYTEVLPGDRLYFIDKSGRINHTGIYIGGYRFIHASARRGCVAVDSLSDPTYWTRFVGARRS
jgi:cell wall-associated NlpC family hydrolase